ncbi:MAG: DUF2442 domain-containing protein, partial [Aliifodinibius sp.]|nr:DUF2442 domain-containing protein [Fodinibius sp.]NIV12589.1 DUF2442 domain-containing protein [Fodinibius sp.]NIY26294.1 DUF2442 domain-containing protein [Fodinibius sp.]
MVDVKADEERISIFLDDERLISFPVNWSPRSEHGTVEERNNWELLGSGMGIHWPDLDEDLSLAGILLGLRSGE